MSKAIKCDRCFKYDSTCMNGGFKRLPLIKFGVGQSEHYYPDNIDLCEECLGSLQEIIERWWKRKR